MIKMQFQLFTVDDESDESEYDAKQHDEHAAATHRSAKSVYESTGELRNSNEIIFVLLTFVYFTSSCIK